MASGSDGLAKADFDINRLSPLEISEELAHALGLKGYCQLTLGLAQGLDEVLEEVGHLHASERFAAPPVEVLEGILGPEGSAELAWLPYPYSEEFADGEALQALTKDLSYMAGRLRPFYEGIGVDGATLRLSQTAVVRGGEHEEDDAPALTEELCSFWLSLFMSPMPLMLLYFLGPDSGTLELRPLDEDSDAVLLTTEPDTLVVLRADLLSHSHTASSDNYLLCSWLTMPILTGPRGWETAQTGPGCLAALKGLSGWIEERLAVLRHSQEEGNMLKGTPRCWQRVMRTHLNSTADIPVGVAGHSMHGASWDCDEFWKTVTNGVDFVSDVPLQRWNHNDFYDPDPEAFLQSHVCTNGITKTAMRHVMFIEGSDLFDPKPFQLSQSESTGMDVQQRHCIECHYESLLQAGYKKKELMNNFIAVFMGGTQPECNYMAYPHGSGGGNLSPAIIANRTSFVMGLMGPSSVIDCEMASAGMALVVGATAVVPNNPYRTECGGDSKAACCGGVYICLTPFMWPRWEAWMNPVGRCFTFDHSAGGYVMGEGCAVAALKAYYDKVAGELITSDATFDGALVAWKHSNSGTGATITAPHAMGIQEVIYKAFHAAGISSLDLDAVDCDGRGGLLDDSIELSATARVCRSVEGSREEPLAIGAAKTNVGAHREVASMAHFIKVLMNIKYASQASGLHLRVLNPHAELGSGALFVNMESLPYRDMHPFHGMNSRGWGGSNVHLIQWHMPDPSIAPAGAPEPRRSCLAFWPGGGGMLERGHGPSSASGYCIVGSWGQWRDPAPMGAAADGTYAARVRLGPNRYETFQIWLDGDSARVLHPAGFGAPSGSAATGPSGLEEADGKNWMIDGRSARLPPPPGGAGDAVEVSARDRGRPGDEYEVTLSVAGKYRAVTWRKVAAADGDEGDARDGGTYYVTGSWNGWGLDEMVRTVDEHGHVVHNLDMGPLQEDGCEFQIIRNRDWAQRFYPPFSTTAYDEWSEYEVCGPDAEGHGKNWCICGKQTQVFRVQFQRLTEEEDVKYIAWHPVEAASLVD